MIVDLRYIFLGCINLFLSFVSLFWLILSLEKCKKFTLQIQLFTFITLNRICRTITYFFIYQTCFGDRIESQFCTLLMRFNQSIDMLASFFNFCCFLILVSFWAQQYHEIKIQDSENFEEDSKTLKRRIKIVVILLI